MARKPVTGRCCPNVECDFHGKTSAGNIIRHSFYKRKDGSTPALSLQGVWDDVLREYRNDLPRPSLLSRRV